MKKINSLKVLFLALAAMFVQSCEEETLAPPQLTAPSAVTSVQTGTKVEITFTFTAAANYKSSSVTATGGTAVVKTAPADGSKEGNIVVEFTAGNTTGAGTVVLTITDGGNQTVNATAVLDIIFVDPTIVLKENLTTQTLDASKPYLIKGQTFIPSGVTLTIPAGTLIKGDKATKGTLIVQPGGKLIAEGTASKPVVFTSAQNPGERDRGDWGGIIILGNAFVNQSAKPAIEGITPTQNYGSIGTDPSINANENSGKLEYVRIEYAGIELTPNNETNSITFGGVGNGTTVNYVQVSFGGDDGFEWFGGTVNGKYLVSHSTWDDDFDTDFGWGGNVQFGLVVRNPFFADQSGSNAFESDNQANGNAIAGVCDATTTAGCTRGVFSNITVLGPRDIVSRSISANYQNGVHIRRRTSISIFNSFVAGFRVGVRVDDQGTLDNLVSAGGVHSGNVLSVPGTTLLGSSTSVSDAAFATGLSSGNAASIGDYWTNNGNGSFIDVKADSVLSNRGIRPALFWGSKTAATYPSDPDFTLEAGKSSITNNLNKGASFTNTKLTGSFFTTTTYRGAFGSTDWTNGWAEFQPLNKIY
ncbi:MAG: hypothetical protein FJZ78_03215 [Bacteroidetes bacterium]|nr:hypothetical protein [Bacteroidota bacterium]